MNMVGFGINQMKMGGNEMNMGEFGMNPMIMGGNGMKMLIIMLIVLYDYFLLSSLINRYCLNYKKTYLLLHIIIMIF